MPMTLKRSINGQVVPIKLSLLDALRWDPEPRKKKGVKPTHPAASIAPKPASEGAATSPASVPAAVSVPNQKSGPTTVVNDIEATANVVSKKGDDEAHTFTAADDAKLIEMKAAGKIWRDIQGELKKSQTALKERFREINPNPSAGADAAKRAGATDGGDGEKKKKGGKGESDQKPKPATSADPKSTTTDKSSDSKTDLSQPTLAQIAARYDKDKWRFAASKHFDLTGERISVEEVKRRVLAGP